MDKQQEIVQMLWDESFNSTQMRCNFVKSDDFEDLAERIVKLFAIPDVVGQSEQLKAFQKMVNETKGYIAISDELIDKHLKSL